MSRGVRCDNHTVAHTTATAISWSKPPLLQQDFVSGRRHIERHVTAAHSQLEYICTFIILNHIGLYARCETTGALDLITLWRELSDHLKTNFSCSFVSRRSQTQRELHYLHYLVVTILCIVYVLCNWYSENCDETSINSEADEACRST